jgi:RND family efflux transporter MFP subunit
MKNKRRSIINILLVLSLIITLGLLYHFWKKTGLAAEEKAQDAGSVPVVVTPVNIRDFEERIVLQGTLEAKTFAMVSARVSGTIESIFVDEGDMVYKEKTRLFEIDSLTLKRKVDLERQELSVAKYARIEAEANLDRVQADFYKTEIDYERFKRLFEKGAVTPEAIEQQESRYKQVKAQRKLAETSVDLAKEKEKKSEAALAIAEKDLRDALIYAPITGRISMKLHEAGEMAQPGMPILRIEDISLIEVSGFLPAQYYARITPGQSTMRIKAYSDELAGQPITYKSPTINPKLRTFEVKCVINAPPSSFVPGAMADIAVFLQQKRGQGVPTEAIQLRGGKQVLFTVEDNKAQMLEVSTGLETDGWTEITAPSLKEDMQVVTMGQFLLSHGTPVRIQRRAD